MTDFPAMEQLIQETVRRTGRLDYIFNNAGIVIGGCVNHYGIEDWNRVVDVNLRAKLNEAQKKLEELKKAGQAASGELKKGVENAWAELKKAFDSDTAKFK